MFSKLSSEESKALKQLLAKAGFSCDKSDASSLADQDLLTGVFEGMAGDEEFEHVAMTDGSKRRLYAENEEVNRYGKTEVKKIGKDGASSGTPRAGMLPPGVADVEMWGRTLMEKGKFAHRHFAYEEMRVCTEQPVSSYVEWLQNHLSDSMNAQFHDFVAYVKAKNAELSKLSNTILIPGSNQIRKLK